MNVWYLFEQRRRKRLRAAAPSRRCDVHLEVLAFKMANEVGVDDRVRTEGGLRVQVENVSLVGHHRQSVV